LFGLERIEASAHLAAQRRERVCEQLQVGGDLGNLDRQVACSHAPGDLRECSHRSRRGRTRPHRDDDGDGKRQRQQPQPDATRPGRHRFDLGEWLRHAKRDALAVYRRGHGDVELLDALRLRLAPVDSHGTAQCGYDLGSVAVVLHRLGIDCRVRENASVGRHDGEAQVRASDELSGELLGCGTRFGGNHCAGLGDRSEVALLLAQSGLRERRVQRPRPRAREDGGDEHVADHKASAVRVGVASQVDHRRTPFSPMSDFSSGSNR
jgi:hypothetical protein